jgi:hypothetical protein
MWYMTNVAAMQASSTSMDLQLSSLLQCSSCSRSLTAVSRSQLITTTAVRRCTCHAGRSNSCSTIAVRPTATKHPAHIAAFLTAHWLTNRPSTGNTTAAHASSAGNAAYALLLLWASVTNQMGASTSSSTKNHLSMGRTLRAHVRRKLRSPARLLSRRVSQFGCGCSCCCCAMSSWGSLHCPAD